VTTAQDESNMERRPEKILELLGFVEDLVY
jgi:hypothetical protein